MKIVRLRIQNFRCIKFSEIFPVKHNVLLGPNNTGKTAVMEALNLLLNPETPLRFTGIDENDFFNREYTTVTANTQAAPPTTSPAPDAAHETSGESPVITIEAVLSDLSSQDEDMFGDHLVPWKPDTRTVVESSPEGVDPFENALPAVRVVFKGKYDPAEDDFDCRTFFLTNTESKPDECPDFTKRHKRYVGFLIYRDFRGLTRPITLEPATLFGRLLTSQGVIPRQFEAVMQELNGSLEPITSDPDFAAVLNSYKAELERFLSLSLVDPSALSFDFTDRTRYQIKEAAQLYVRDGCCLPLQKMGAGTRSLAILGILTLIMRRRQRGILALEEPETFLFPHAQRRVMDECLAIELEGVAVVSTDTNGDVAKTGTFFHEAGLSVVCVVDQVKDSGLISELCATPFSVLFLKYFGLEQLLSQELPVDLLRLTLSTAPHSRVPLLDASVVAALTEADVRSEFEKFMIGKKGSAHLHEWVLAQLDENTLPPTLKNILDTATSLLSGTDVMKTTLL